VGKCVDKCVSVWMDGEEFGSVCAWKAGFANGLLDKRIGRKETVRVDEWRKRLASGRIRGQGLS
jgi:hypothetical protein